MTESPPSGRAAAPAVARAAKILGNLAAHPGPQRLSDVASALGLPVSSTAAICTALEGDRLVTRTSTGYTLGPRIVELAHAFLATIDPLTSFGDVVAESDTLRHETVQLAILDGAEVLYLARRDADRPFQIASNVGKRLPATCTAVGKAMLAGAAVDVARRGPLPRLTARSITDPQALRDDLATTAARGYAIDDEETSIGVVCFGVALNVADPRYAISVTILRANHSPELEAELVAALQQAARALSPGSGESVPPFWGPGLPRT
ncbi:IclR family transcriptional regulator [soil metagenome]